MNKLNNQRLTKCLATLGRKLLLNRAIDVISKSDSQSEFYVNVAKQIDKVFAPLIGKSGGAMSLIDIFLYYNRMRGAELITPDDLLHATRQFGKINSSLELREAENGIKIVQLRITNEDEDFFKYCVTPIKARQNGISVEEIVKLFGLSLLVARDKLESYAKKGKLVVDSSLEGIRYYLNDIITFEFK